MDLPWIPGTDLISSSDEDDNNKVLCFTYISRVHIYLRVLTMTDNSLINN